MITADDIESFAKADKERVIEVERVEEHEDGSATYSLDLDEDTTKELASIGAKILLYCMAAKLSLNELYDILNQYIEEKSDEE
jgi:hypothetical protein